jgi:peptidoglycan/xylan/chitin deacetylase (PgdA/CDA1 family)
MKSWFSVLPLDEAARRLASGTLPDRAAAISFDDGYADNATIALPILREHQVAAAFFVATGFLDGGRMWNDTIIEAVRGCRLSRLDLDDIGLGAHAMTTPGERRIAIENLIAAAKYLPPATRASVADSITDRAGVRPPTDLMMTGDQVRAMRQAGMQIGAHTVSHPILTQLASEDARREMSESKARLETILEEKVSLFAYPNGKRGQDYSGEHCALARDVGFEAAFTTAPAAARTGCDIMQVPRFTPWDRSRFRFGTRLALNLRRA